MPIFWPQIGPNYMHLQCTQVRRLVVNNCKMRAWILTLKWWSHYQVLCSEFFAYHNSSSGLRHRGFSCSIFFGAAAEFESIQNVAWDLLPRQTKERALKCRKMMCCWHVANQFEADYTWKMCSLTILYDVGNLTADCYLTKNMQRYFTLIYVHISLKGLENRYASFHQMHSKNSRNVIEFWERLISCKAQKGGLAIKVHFSLPSKAL